ncbi:uncharacterized protein CC84DRAFT_961948 [Paraphaeosphaeria sporulosa]|uniref:Uncharacterized protein n=1 Tax=Paraphaeosphaeria sporulosa TaxID=1460663 RepID=A0A177C8U0_9PLEO|nr:uncharacterized protein CC84DRAFT_961948 [Paraphaeosphaeria sporulosa]OAG03188.1 hypothetical protein CC84DRAFT_961948 [Paraphaeosphaeria sporulosa]
MRCGERLVQALVHRPAHTSLAYLHAGGIKVCRERDLDDEEAHVCTVHATMRCAAILRVLARVESTSQPDTRTQMDPSCPARSTPGFNTQPLSATISRRRPSAQSARTLHNLQPRHPRSPLRSSDRTVTASQSLWSGEGCNTLRDAGCCRESRDRFIGCEVPMGGSALCDRRATRVFCVVLDSGYRGASR